MKIYELSGTARNDFGKKAAKNFRRQGLVPCNLYGLGINKTFAVKEADVQKLIITPVVYAVKLDIDGAQHMAVIKELQFHPVKDNVLHIDFLAVDEKKPVEVAIPIRLEGHAEGVKAGGKLALLMRKLNVKGIYTDIPEEMIIDINNLGLGKKMLVADLHFDKLEITNVKSAVVVQVKATRASAQAAAEGGEQ